MTGHMWDGQWILANGKRWASLPADVQAVITKHVTDAVMKQRDDIRRLTNVVEAQLKGKGMIFNYPENKSFRDALSKAGFYKEWRGKFGDEAMAKLEKYSGKLA
jgi:TRAP-type C4-dicarboxylate transport system substrate-binding protein